MSNRGKHLLEAFKVGGPSSAAPPAAPTKPAAPLAPSLPLRSAPGRGVIALRAAHLQLLVLVQVVMVVLAFLIGRMSAHTVAAAPEQPTADVEANVGSESAGAAQPSGEQAPVPPAGNAAPNAGQESAPRTVPEQALADRKNVYTVKVVEYANTDAQLKLAFEAMRYLTDTHALPACLIRKEARLYILVGAAPAKSDLEPLLDTVRRINGPPPGSRPAEFHDAYAERIDNVFPRK